MKRKKIKTIFCHMAIITICMGVFCYGYINGASISGNDRIYSYAEADNWSSCDTSDLVTAFRYYCKSRNLAIEGSTLDSLTTFTTTSFNNIVSTLGIDPTHLQAQLKKTTEGNLGTRYLFSLTGITAYNRIFSEFLQNNNLEVGDTLDNQSIYDGYTGTDGNGNGFTVWIVKNTGQNADFNYLVAQKGSFYRYNSSYDYENHDSLSFGFANIALSKGTTNYTNGYNVVFGTGHNASIFKSLSSAYNAYGYPIIFASEGATTFNLYLGSFSKFDYKGGRYSITSYQKLTTAGSNPNVTYNITNITGDTNNNEINNNNYSNNYTIIYNDGDTYYTDDDEEPLPSTPPGGGGGGGGGDDPGTDPDIWDPTTPTIPDPSSPDFPSVNLPDIDIPDLPSLNFSLGDLRNKFPFSLPFDIIAVLNVLDGEPQAPHIEANVPIGRWYTWEMDFDFSEFDNYARIFRGFEFIGFCIGLAIFTVHFVKG